MGLGLDMEMEMGIRRGFNKEGGTAGDD